MICTYKDVLRVTFPVFHLPNDNWSYSDGLLLIDNQIVDDQNMSGDSLGLRRVQTPHKNLLPLRRSVLNLTGIIKQNTSTFIDSKGIPFIYEKTEWFKLRYYKIKKVEKKGIASLLWLHGVSKSSVIPRPPHTDMKWAGMLLYNEAPWLLYQYAEEKQKDSKRKV